MYSEIWSTPLAIVFYAGRRTRRCASGWPLDETDGGDALHTCDQRECISHLSYGPMEHHSNRFVLYAVERSLEANVQGCPRQRMKVVVHFCDVHLCTTILQIEPAAHMPLAYPDAY
jgi:hypothetical protein